jgi:hypothetical protein
VSVSSLAYYTNQELPGIPFRWADETDDVLDYSAGFTFHADLVRGDSIIASESTNIVGAASSPNVTISKWSSTTLTAIAADLTTLGRRTQSYELRLYARRVADSADDVLKPGAPPIVQFTVAAT